MNIDLKEKTKEFNTLNLTKDVDNTETAAYLKPAANGKPAVINVSIPQNISQLKGQLPPKGNVAIWIEEAEFYVEGVEPNDKGKVMMNVSTSGTYENGFTPDVAFRAKN